MRRAVIAFCLLLTASAARAHEPAIPRTGYRLVWQDEFGGTPWTAPDAAKWSYTLHKDNEDEVEVYTTRTVNACLVPDPAAEDGMALRIQAVKEADGTLTSARLTTQHKFEFTYGRVECRARLPKGQGLWPAFWMLGADIEKVDWPQCGEVDVMEAIGREPSVNHGSLHGPRYPEAGLTSEFTLPDGARFADAYHLFSIEWTREAITFAVDGKPYKTFAPKDAPKGGWVYDHPFYLIAQLALGGDWSGAPDATTVFPQSLLVDFVRVYQLPSVR